MDAPRDVLEARLLEDVARENKPRLDFRFLQERDEITPLDVRLERDRKAEPRRIRLGMDHRHDDVLFPLRKPFEIKRGVLAARGDERGQLLELRAADRRLHVAHLEIVAEVGIDVFVIVAVGERAELPVEALAAGIAHARLAPAIAAPVAHGKARLAHAALVDDDHAALAQGHVMRGIKRNGRHRAERADELAVPRRAERVAAVLEQPEIVLLREGRERVEIARNADRMRNKNRARLRPDRRLDLRRVDVVNARLAIDKNRDEPVLHQRRQRGRKCHRRRDDLVARAAGRS